MQIDATQRAERMWLYLFALVVTSRNLGILSERFAFMSFCSPLCLIGPVHDGGPNWSGWLGGWGGVSWHALDSDPNGGALELPVELPLSVASADPPSPPTKQETTY